MNMLSQTRIQVNYLLRSWVSIITFTITTVLVLLNFTLNVNTFRGTDVNAMIEPMRMLTLSYEANVYDMRMMGIVYIPIILSVFSGLPAGLSFAKDRQLCMDVMLTAKLGRKAYCLSRLMAVFITTFIIFSVPFFIEIVLNCISFPLDANGNYMQWSIYNDSLKTAVGNYMFSGLYLASPYLYAVLCTLMFGIIAGLSATFTFSLTLVIKLRYRIFYVLPVFILFQISIRLYASSDQKLNSLSLIHYIMFFDDTPKNYPFLVAAIIIALAFIAFAYVFGSREDTL